MDATTQELIKIVEQLTNELADMKLRFNALRDDHVATISVFSLLVASLDARGALDKDGFSVFLRNQISEMKSKGHDPKAVQAAEQYLNAILRLPAGQTKERPN